MSPVVGLYEVLPMIFFRIQNMYIDSLLAGVHSALAHRLIPVCYIGLLP